MTETNTRLLRADWIVPVGAPPIERGEIVIEEGRIAEVRAATRATGAEVEEFGPAVLMPGLVNVHTHLDYTLMRGLLEDLEFFPWIRELTARAMTLTAEDWQASACWGAAEALSAGVTTLGDCSFSGAALDAAVAFGLGGIVYREVFGIDEQRPVDQIVAELTERVESMRRSAAGAGMADRLEVGISPHAPYTVRPALFRALASLASERNLPVCIHAAESQAEAELLRSGSGPFADMYRRREIVWEPPQSSTVAYLDSLGILGPRTLLVHGVQLSAADRAIAMARDVAWAHCPKSNAKLGVGTAALGLLGDPAQFRGGEGLAPRIGLGSDSVASNNTMDLFEEMRFAVLMQRAARRRIGALGASEAVAMATLGGARALGLESRIGTLEAGKSADLCVVRCEELHSAPTYHPCNALVYAGRASDVIATYVEGRKRYDVRRGTDPIDRFPENDLRPVRDGLRHAAGKMRDWRPSS